jgi:hypothetical protein
MKRKACYEIRYIVTDVVSVPVSRLFKKSEAYRAAVGPGWGTVDWYSAANNYKAPVNRDKDDKTQVLFCDDDSSAVLYPRSGKEFSIFLDEAMLPKDFPKQSEVDAIITSDSCGFSFWQKDEGDINIFVTYDENGLIDTYRLDNWNGKPYDGETEILFSDLQSEYDYDHTSRAEIAGTYEYQKKMSGAAA